MLAAKLKCVGGILETFLEQRWPEIMRCMYSKAQKKVNSLVNKTYSNPQSKIVF